MGASSVPIRTQAIGALIDALTADTEMVLVAAAEAAETLAPTVWARAAYLVRLSPGATEAEGLRALLQEVLSRGRDAVLVTTLDTPELTAETVRRMVAAYRDAGHEIWAIVSDHALDSAAQEPESAPVYPVLLGRTMIESLLRGREWRSAREVLAANREHVHALNLSR
jgi:CTP:molybdopterin cytidylyltransferase MocA